MFKIGQKVVCKDTEPNHIFKSTPLGIIKDKIYTITNIDHCPSCGHLLLGLAESTHTGIKHCAICDELITSSNLYHSYRFEPVVYDFLSSKDLLSNQIDEKCDIPTHEPVLS